MAQLTFRNVDDDIAAELKARAARTGRSAEAEHRRILEQTVRPARSLPGGRRAPEESRASAKHLADIGDDVGLIPRGRRHRRVSAKVVPG
jgi:plasmid stability protein